MANGKLDRDLIAARLQRLDGLTTTQRTSLAQTLNPAIVRTMSDGQLAALVNAQIPTLPINPEGGLPLGLPGAVQPTRYVGATTAGAPITGSFLHGDFALSLADGVFYVCTVAGTPGTWIANAGTGGGSSGLTATQVQAIVNDSLVGN